MLFGTHDAPYDDSPLTDELAPCDPASYPSGDSGVCWESPRPGTVLKLAKCDAIEACGVEVVEVRGAA